MLLLCRIFLKKIYSMLLYRKSMLVKDYFLVGERDIYPICPRCNSTFERDYQSYCDRCGQCLEWNE